jgi:hypothetical protein
VWLSPAWALEASLGADASFRTYDLLVDTVGTVGHTPRLWLSFGLGAVFRAKDSEKKPPAAPM